MDLKSFIAGWLASFGVIQICFSFDVYRTRKKMEREIKDEIEMQEVHRKNVEEHLRTFSKSMSDFSPNHPPLKKPIA